MDAYQKEIKPKGFLRE